MRKYLYRLLSLFIVFMTLGANIPTRHIINFYQCSIDGIKLRNNIEEIIQQIDAQRIEKKVETLEGEPNVVYWIYFDKHIIYKHWNAISFTDSIFRDKNGIGVNSTLKQVEQVYGKGKVSFEEGQHISFEGQTNENEHFYFSVRIKEQIPYTPKPSTARYLDAKITEIWVW